MARFEELEVWKKSARLSADLYKAMVSNKDFGFRDQITRASLSIPCNIAEGYERESDKEIALFLNYAKGAAGALHVANAIAVGAAYLLTTDKQLLKKMAAEPRIRVIDPIDFIRSQYSHEN